MNQVKYWEYIKKKKINILNFIHTPKCGGTYTENVINNLNKINHRKINFLGHKLANKTNEINFTIFRNPIERFESLLNYRLSNKKRLRDDWPKRLIYVYKNENISLNKIVNMMTKNEILNFRPYRTLNYWFQNIDICITINQLKDFLEFFGYKYPERLQERINNKNISKKGN